MNRQRLPVIAGPTASGKTALAVSVAKALDGEVVSADSMQVYQGIPIATACPTTDERDGVVHHLQEYVPLEQSYSVARYAKDARRVIQDIGSKGKLPILCGGTGLYIAAVTDNVCYEDQDDIATASVRERLTNEALTLGDMAMWEKLQVVDPVLAAKLHYRDRGRILRGLEVYETSGIPMSVLQERQRSVPTPYDVTMILLDFHDRQRLYDRINLRVDVMLENGLLEETARVLRVKSSTAEQAIGCKELRPYFDGECSLKDALESMKRRSRQYAKRQLSWFRRLQNAHTLYVDEYDSVSDLTSAALNCLSL